MKARVVLATHNQHKLAELRQILAGENLPTESIVSAADLGVAAPREDGLTFAANALIKARALARATGLVAIADDSGLEVDVLGGAPGIFSARWCGHHGDDQANLELLLAQLADVGESDRGAQFTCAAVMVNGDDEVVEVAHLRGRLGRTPVGNAGFGYDPIFIAAGLELTNAQLTPAHKNAISHRGRALRALAPHLARVLA